MQVTNRFPLIFILLSTLLSAADNDKKQPKKHCLDDPRLQQLLTKNPEMLTIESFLNHCRNPKLTCTEITASLTDPKPPKPLQITRKAYFDLIHITYVQIQDIVDGTLLWHGALRNFPTEKLVELRAYLCDGCNEQTLKMIKPYYGPPIMWVSQQLLGVSLPVEICKKILCSIDSLPDCAPYKIFKTDAMIMLRYASQAYPMPDYKQHYKFPSALDALW